ncbi:YihY family inner membrane protein [Endozoicomonas sp. YOMI1]|uniref:YihY family inner membrane protein n=1 Tax=Endozoicomonas sp. YOMI1 TaxID=2828739 RepID=UPI0021496811|nr:YihY family inner membrane protein [Endozoicomonas sp. YOMI1]
MATVLQFWSSFQSFVTAVIKRFLDNRCIENAAALTYTTLFAVVPLMTVTYSILSAVPSLQDVGDTIQNFIFTSFVPSTGEIVQSYLNDFSQQARKLTSIGVAFLLVTSFLMLRTIDKALNNIWQVAHVRRGMTGFLLYWAILSLGPVLLSAGFLTTSYLASLKLVSHTTAILGGEQWLLRLMPVFLSTLVLTLLYTAVPNRKVPVRHALVGAVFVAILVELAKAGFTLFITLSPTYHLIYGAFAAVPLFLLWVYLSWLMVLFGAVLVRSLDLYGKQVGGERPHPLISILLILKQLQEKFEQGQGLHYTDLRKRDLPVSLDDWESHTVRLMEMGLINKNDGGEWILARDLRQISLFTFCEQLPWPMPQDEQLRNILIADDPNWLSDFIQRAQAVNSARLEALDCSLDQLLSK